MSAGPVMRVVRPVSYPDVRYPRFSLWNLLTTFLVVALCLALVQARVQIANLQSELRSVLPLRELDIKAQFEAATAAEKVPAVVHEVSFNPLGATYFIVYAFRDPSSGAEQVSHVLLQPEGDGRYVGFLRTGPYIKKAPDENGEWGTRVVVVRR